MLKRLLLPLLGLILSNIKTINTRLAALEAGEIAETQEEMDTELEMQKLFDSMNSDDTIEMPPTT